MNMELKNIIDAMIALPTENCGIDMQNGRYAQIYRTRQPLANSEWPKYVRMKIFNHAPSNPDTTWMGDYGKLEIWINKNGIERYFTMNGYHMTDDTLNPIDVAQTFKQYVTNN